MAVVALHSYRGVSQLMYPACRRHLNKTMAVNSKIASAAQIS
jgi:hypothetical protein